MHISTEDLERYHLGMIHEADFQELEVHILSCPYCAMRAEEAAEYVDEIRVALMRLES